MLHTCTLHAELNANEGAGPLITVVDSVEGDDKVIATPLTRVVMLGVDAPIAGVMRDVALVVSESLELAAVAWGLLVATAIVTEPLPTKRTGLVGAELEPA